MKPVWFGTLSLVGVTAVMAPAILLAASGSGQGFDAVVRGIEKRYQVHATHIPFMSLISGVARLSTHGGVRGLHVAEIDNFPGDGKVDGAELNALVEQRAGQGWQRIVRETSRGGNEQSLIYARPEGDHMAMLVVDLDGKEMDIVQMSVDPDQLMQEAFEKHRHGSAHDSDGSDRPDSDKPDGDKSGGEEGDSE